MSRNSAGREHLLASINKPEVQAIILYGLHTGTQETFAQETLLRTTIAELAEGEKFHPVRLSLRSILDQSRAEIIHHLAVVIIDVTGQRRAMLDSLSPDNFHTDFMAQIIAGLRPIQSLLFVLDEIDFQDRSQLSKLNNLILPLLRRLARLKQIKFILVVEGVETTKSQAVLQPIFTGVEEIEVMDIAQEIMPEQQEEIANGFSPFTAGATEPKKATSAQRRSLLLAVLIIVIVTLLANIYVLLTMLQRL